jgi:hypothetical protein
MSKSVLVIDTPERGCISCSIGQNDSNCRITRIYCPIAGKSALDGEAESIPDWCPLKPLPEKMTGVAQTDHWNSIKEGWNECIDEIGGGK